MVQLSHLCMTTRKTKQGKKESEVAQSCPTLCDPMDCSLPGFSVHGIFQASVLEWVAISFFRGSSRSRDQTGVSLIVGRCFYRLSHQGSRKNHSFDSMDIFWPSDVVFVSGFYHSAPCFQCSSVLSHVSELPS